jgi:hypothetical protein
MMLRNDPRVKLRPPRIEEHAMNVDLYTPTLSLPRDGLIALRDARCTAVTALSGALWITEDGAPRDIILEAGQRAHLCRPGLTLIMALQPASLRLSERRDRAARGLGGWLRRCLPGGPRDRLDAIGSRIVSL